MAGRRPRTALAGIISLTLAFLDPASPRLGAISGTSTTEQIQTAAPVPNTATGVIAGVVVDGKGKPLSRVQVLAFSVRTLPAAARSATVPFSMRADGSAYTNDGGHFEIAGLEPGDYLVAAQPLSLLPSGSSELNAVFATTFHPSTTDYRMAERIKAATSPAAPIRIELVQVRGARVAGTVTSRSGRATGGLDVRMFYSFGGFGSESPVGVVSTDGTFAIARVPPGWYRLSIGTRSGSSTDESREFATRLIEVRDRDIDDLSIVLSTGASIAGRVVADGGGTVEPAPGWRVSASPGVEQYSALNIIVAKVTADGTFRMTALPGAYEFTAGADRPPYFKATRIAIDGVESAAGSTVDLTDGRHDVVLFVAPRKDTAPAIDRALSVAALVEQFKREKIFWRQFTIAAEIVARKDVDVLPALAAWLTHEDRHVRGNTALIFGGLGDPRGFQVIAEILSDRSDRPEGQGMAGVSSDGRYRVERQIAADRYYAAHLLGDLRDPRAVPILVPLLRDKDVRSVVPWALGQIGDRSAIAPLMDVLDDDDPSMRVLVIYELEKLNAREALPRLTVLLDDHRPSNFGGQVTVAEAARAAIAKLR